MISAENNGWIEGLPTEPGDYWFYRYRVLRGCKSLSAVEQGSAFVPASGGIMCVAADFLYPQSFNGTTNRVWYKRLVLPVPPNFDRTCPECKGADEWVRKRCFHCSGTGEL